MMETDGKDNDNEDSDADNDNKDDDDKDDNDEDDDDEDEDNAHKLLLPVWKLYFCLSITSFGNKGALPAKCLAHVFDSHASALVACWYFINTCGDNGP